MRRRPPGLPVHRALLVHLVAVLALAALAGVASAHDGPNSTSAARIWGLHRLLLAVAVPIALLVEAAILYAIWRFRRAGEPTPTPEKRWLELTWTVATALVLAFVGVAAYGAFTDRAVTASAGDAGPADVRVNLTAHQWHWTVEYPGENVTVDRARTIYLPANRTVTIAVTSRDVIHSLHVPRLALKQDAFPGQWNYIRTRIAATGEYRFYCAEYCGEGHARMRGTVRVVPYDEYRAWLANQSG